MSVRLTRHLCLTFVVVFLATYLLSCDKDKLPEPQPTACDPVPTYDNQIKPIIDLNCAFSGCHDGSGDAPGDFTTFAGMEGRLQSGKIAERALITQDMPEPPFVITAEHFDSLKCWIENGFPKN